LESFLANCSGQGCMTQIELVTTRLYGMDVPRSYNPLGSDGFGNKNRSQQPFFSFLYIFGRPLYNTDGRVVASVGGLFIPICSLCKSVVGLSTNGDIGHNCDSRDKGKDKLQ
jgi:hypothetical protein